MSISGISQPMEVVPVLGTPVHSGFLFDSSTVSLLDGFVFLCCCDPKSHTPRCVLKSEEATSLY